MKFRYRILIISCFIVFTGIYAYLARSKFNDLFESRVEEVILKSIPSFDLKDVHTDKLVSSDSIYLKNPDVVIFHIWGTWCAPCEKEFPELSAFTSLLSKRNIRFVLLAINDKKSDVIKFLKKYEGRFENTIFLYSENDKILEKFGSARVPDTYIFKKNRDTYKVLQGPQEWGRDYYKNLIISLVESQDT